MLKGFRDFILRGNVVDLAVAVIIGAAFGAITTSLVGDIITPLIAAIVGKPNFDYLVLHVHGGAIAYGKFLNALISFVLNAAAIYFLIVVPMKYVMAKFDKPAEVTTKPCPQCLSDIPVAATRCKFCTQPV
ncbi:MAG: large conductance mechanosensitive channel protein MscL [Terriglobus sp.]